MTCMQIRTDRYPTRKQSQTFRMRLEFVILIAANNEVAVFSEMSDISTSTLRTYLRGDSDPSMNKLIAIANTSGVQLEWLMLGTGPVYCETTIVPILSLKEAADVIGKNTEIQMYNRDRRNMIDNIQIRPDVLLEQFGVKPENIVIAEHEGYTMASSLNQGDWLLLDRVNTEPNHGLYLVAFKDGYDIRRIIRHPNGALTLSCDNEKYPDFTLSQQEIDELSINILAKVRHAWKARDM